MLDANFETVLKGLKSKLCAKRRVNILFVLMIMSNKFTIKAIAKMIMVARLASKMMLLMFSALTPVDTEFNNNQ